MQLLLPSPFPSSIPDAMGLQQILAEEVLSKVIEFDIFSPETIGRSYTTNTCKLGACSSLDVSTLCISGELY
jgi:hypothetical protein